MTGATVVVGAALLDYHGRVLAAQRSGPQELAGLWEFPGGKVEAGEGEQDALRRECHEELGVEIVVGERLGPDVQPRAGLVLRVWLARVVAGRPVPTEHAALRWLGPRELYSVPWLPADRPLVDALAIVMSGLPGGARRTMGEP